MRKRVATLTSNILNPFLVTFVIIVLLSFESASGIASAFKWSLILVGVNLLPVLLVSIYFVRSGRLDAIFTNTRQQRTKIYLLACACLGTGLVILLFLEAPLMLVAASVAAISAAVLFMTINLQWKISIHTAFITASVTALIILYGWIAAVMAVLVALMAWARIELEHHSLAQVTVGAFLAALIIVVVFRLFGLV